MFDQDANKAIKGNHKVDDWKIDISTLESGTYVVTFMAIWNSETIGGDAYYGVKISVDHE